jgi:steroid delta-isomerase-like uncharacterized protein
MTDSRSIVWAYYDAFNRGDWAGMLELLSKDVVHEINQGGVETGKRKFQAFLKHMEQCYKEELEEIVVMSDPTGERLAAEFIVVGTYLRTDGSFPPARGQEYRLPAGAFFTVIDGRIERVATVYNVKEWLSQVQEEPEGE